MNREVKELIEEIKGFGNCGFFTMTTEERDLLLDYINQLETNRDELKKWLENDEEKAMMSFAAGRHFNYSDVLKKIEELERGKE